MPLKHLPFGRTQIFFISPAQASTLNKPDLHRKKRPFATGRFIANGLHQRTQLTRAGMPNRLQNCSDTFSDLKLKKTLTQVNLLADMQERVAMEWRHKDKAGAALREKSARIIE